MSCLRTPVKTTKEAPVMPTLLKKCSSGTASTSPHGWMTQGCLSYMTIIITITIMVALLAHHSKERDPRIHLLRLSLTRMVSFSKLSATKDTWTRRWMSSPAYIYPSPPQPTTPSSRHAITRRRSHMPRESTHISPNIKLTSLASLVATWLLHLQGVVQLMMPAIYLPDCQTVLSSPGLLSFLPM